MSELKVTKEMILKAIDDGLNIYKCMDRFSCSKTTVRNALKRYKLQTPKKFYTKKDSKVGRPPGFTYTEEQLKIMSERVKGDKNPFYGKKHTEESKRKMSENHADISGENNPFRNSLLRNPEKLIEHKERCKKIWDSRDDEYRNNFGEKISYALATSDNVHQNYARHISGFVHTEKAGKLFHRSSWEKRMCVFLDKCNCVINFDLEPFCVKYINSKGKIRYTRIDFWIKFTSGNEAICEVKPIKLLEYKENGNKIKGQKLYCKKNHIQYRIIHKNDLDNLDVIMIELNNGEHYVT